MQTLPHPDPLHDLTPRPKVSSPTRNFDAAHVWHPYAAASESGLVVREAEGVHLVLEDGTRLLDGMASWWSAIHGYRHPVLQAALAEQVSRMSHVMFGGLTHEAAVELARALLAIAPEGLETVFFSDSGSVSVEVAIKMALQYQRGEGREGRTRLMALRGGYHGDTLGAMSITDPGVGLRSPIAGVPEQVFAPRPRVRFGQPWEEGAERDVEEVFLRHAHELAAVVVEPIAQNAGGMWFYAPQYLAALRRLCDEHDVLLVCDEIATGFGRTGRMFAVEHAQVRPDVMCVGKALSGGMLSLAATLTTRRVADGVGRGEPGVLLHGPTFMANPAACAVARASIELLVQGPWRERVETIERQLGQGLAPCRELPGVADVRVLGAIGVVQTEEPIDVSRVQAAAIGRGVWLRPFRDLLYTMPPYVTSEGDIAKITAAMYAALSG